MGLFYNFKHSEVVEKVTMKWPCDDYIIPAGTPMSRTGIANNGDAIGILASEARVQFDFPLSVAKHIGKKEPKGNKDFTFEIITGGFVNLTDAESAFGEKYTDEAKAAMSGISFVDESGEGMGGGASSWNDLKDKPFGEETTVTKEVREFAVTSDGRGYVTDVAFAELLFDNKDKAIYEDNGGVCVFLPSTVAKRGGSAASWEVTRSSGTGTWAVYANWSTGEVSFGAFEAGQFVSGKITILQEEITVRTIDQKFLPEALQFGEGIVEVTVECDAVDTTDFTCDNFPAFAVGDAVTVKVDGAEYSLIAFDDDGYVTIGDKYQDIQSGEGVYGWQFFIAPNSEIVLFVPISGESHTISYMAKTVRTIDQKYLPQGVGGAMLIYDLDAETVNGAEPTVDDWVAWTEAKTPVYIRQNRTLAPAHAVLSSFSGSFVLVFHYYDVAESKYVQVDPKPHTYGTKMKFTDGLTPGLQELFGI